MASITKYRKIILRLAEDAAWIAYVALFDDDVDDVDLNEAEWRRVVLKFTRTAPSGATEDAAYVKFDIFSLGDDWIPATWSTGHYTQNETILNTWWGSVKPYVSANHTLAEYRWYRMSFANPMAVDRRFNESGPPLRVTTVGVPGTDAVSSYNPFQVAMSITLKTAHRKHWGRIYLPGIANQRVGSTSRFTAAACDAVANATNTMIGSMLGNVDFPFIPSTQADKVLAPAMLSITAVQVDDVPDVVRSRRPKTTTYRKTLTA